MRKIGVKYIFSLLDIVINDKTQITKSNQDLGQKNRPRISAQRVGFFNIGSGRVLDKIPGSGSGSGRVGVSKYTIRYFRVSFLLSGISGYFGYFRVCRVFLGISGFTHIY